jgi:hypothetical protein
LPAPNASTGSKIQADVSFFSAQSYHQETIIIDAGMLPCRMNAASVLMSIGVIYFAVRGLWKIAEADMDLALARFPEIVQYRLVPVRLPQQTGVMKVPLDTAPAHSSGSPSGP